jgi:NAD(P)-dependent dehydrogenase (short-subunit alcohol dehydrogenase family)
MGNVEGSARSNGFNWYSTAEEAARNADLKGKYFIVTGASAGIGIETTRVLAKLGGHVTLAVRDVKKGEGVVEKLVESLGEDAKARLSVSQLDLTDFSSIRGFAKRYTDPLDVLINNAGTMACPYAETKDGLELQMGTNHVGHFLLTTLLLPKLKQSKFGGRVINVASAAHRVGGVQFDDITGKDTWYTGMMGKWKAYGQSKTANILFGYELNRRMADEGANVTAYSLHPGAISTELQRHMPTHEKILMSAANTAGFMKSVPQGAATSVYLATAPLSEIEQADVGMRYFSDSNRAVPYSYVNPENAKRLWEWTEEVIKSKS